MEVSSSLRDKLCLLKDLLLYREPSSQRWTKIAIGPVLLCKAETCEMPLRDCPGAGMLGCVERNCRDEGITLTIVLVLLL